jgi:acyl carrier protein
MTDAEIYRGLTDVFRDIFDDSTIELKAGTSAADIPEWTSFNHISIIVASEQKFEVKFSTPDIEMLKNVGDLVALIQAKSAKKHR